jgi:hypothetical protein
VDIDSQSPKRNIIQECIEIRQTESFEIHAMIWLKMHGKFLLLSFQTPSTRVCSFHLEDLFLKDGLSKGNKIKLMSFKSP